MRSTDTSKEKKFNHIKHVHVIFYSVIESQIFYLLHKDLNSESEPKYFSEFYIELANFDNAPTFAASRLMTCVYNGLFTKKFIEETKKGSKLQKIEFEEENSWYQMWNCSIFWEWLEVFSNNPIQYDTLENIMIYFLEIPPLALDILQSNFKIINPSKFYEFNYYTYNDIVGKILDKDLYVLMKTKELFNLIDPDIHITKTANLFSNNLAEKVIIISCKPPEKNQNDQAGIYHFKALFQGLYRNNNEKWIFLTASVDGLPDDSMLKNTKAVIIPGSNISVYDKHEYLTSVKKFLSNLAKNYPDIKILGICFGAQIVAESLGGKVFLMKRDYFSGIESIEFMKNVWDLDFVRKSGVTLNENIKVMKFHGDEIRHVPKGFTNLGTSQSCKNEVLISESKKIFLIQGHPEYEPKFAFVRSLSQNVKINKNIKITENCINYIQCYSKGIDNYDENNFRKICYSFLKN